MKHLSVLLLLLILLPAVRAERGDPVIQNEGASIDQMVAEFMREHEVSGMSVAIVQAPYITRVTGHGLSDKERHLLASSNTLFNLGQMSRAYTAVAVMQLVESGKIALDDPLGRHLPSVSAPWKSITIRQALQHQSGQEAVSDEAHLRELIAAASGKSYREFVRAGQFEPLGLKHTFFAADLGRAPQEDIKPGARHGKFLHDAPMINPSEAAIAYEKGAPAKPSDDAIYASAEDVSIWDIGLAGDILIKDASLRKILYQPLVLKEGKTVPSSGPWFFPGRPGLMVVTGSEQGFSSLLSRFTDPKDLLCVTLLANKEGLDLTQLARRIAGAYDARIGPPPGTSTMRIQQSPYSVTETLARLEKALKAGGAGIIARVDHAKAAGTVSLDLPPTEEIIFGSPAKGTLLMQSNRAVALDLPLRAVAWEDKGAVWVAAIDPVEIAHRHGITDREEVVEQMRQGIDAALLQAVSGS